MSNPLIYILIAPPGSGKGTQAILLSEKFDLYHLETSKIIEQKIMGANKGAFAEIDNKKYFFEKEKELWQKGILCSPEFVAYLIKEKIQELHKEKKGIVFSGSPRTLYEGEKLVPFMIELYKKENIKVFEILLSPEESIFRNSHRRICELMRHPILWTKETENLEHCPLDGSKLLRRKGLDDPETIKTRLKEYKERTYPLIDYFENQALDVKKIKGEQTVEQVFKEILSNIK
ncbi:MAG: nucleoside monophosphate kinase [Patescibacteria group bacterium]|nr:nucleoside monophosphate kinase [Patescibacteria group bacterium]